MEHFPNSLDLFYISIWEFGELIPFSVVSRNTHLGVHNLLLKPAGSKAKTSFSLGTALVSFFALLVMHKYRLVLTQPLLTSSQSLLLFGLLLLWYIKAAALAFDTTIAIRLVTQC